jgi:NAD(P)-dependent dehydrogenase (short-subunit alcohol dehydrogenase family)
VLKAIVFGASSGLGSLVANGLHNLGFSVLGVGLNQPESNPPFRYMVCDISDDKQRPCILRRFKTIHPEEEGLDLLVNCAGVNKIGYMENFCEEDWDKVLDTNLRSAFFLMKDFKSLLELSGGSVCHVVSNASHMPMTGSAAYNCSKAGLAMLVHQTAREFSKTGSKVTVFGISPNKMNGTAMSADIEKQVQQIRGWTEEEARAYQISSLLAKEETPPQVVADFMLYLLQEKQRHRFLTGCIMDYGA